MHLIKALLLAVLLAQVEPASASERSILQYTHQSWTEEIDAPRPVSALAQDQRGYLWVASALGLFRFDGIHFVPMSSQIDSVRHGMPSALLVRRNGEVWTNFERSGRFGVYRDGWLRLLDGVRARARVMAMHETRDGTIWVLTEQIGTPLMRYRDGRWTSFGVASGLPLDNAFSMVVTSDGSVWVSFAGSVARLPPGSSRFQVVRNAPGSLGRLSMDPQERIWFSERRGTYPITGPGGHGSPPPLRYAYATDSAEIRGWPTFDREGNLWIATYYDGLQRISRPDPSGAASPADARSRVERFTEREGLSSKATSQIFQDKEGNVWATTEGGLDRFWPATIRFEPQLTDPAAFGDLFLRASDGTVYIGEASVVYRVRPGGDPEPIFRTKVEPSILCEAPDGAIWIGVDKDVVVWRDGRVRRLTRVPLEYTLYDCAFDSKGDYWVTAARGGMARFSHGRWQRAFGPTGTAFLPKSMVVDDRGRLVVHWSAGILSRLDANGRQSIAIPSGDYEPNDVTLYPASGSLFVAGRFGLARLRNDRFQSLSARRFPLLSGVNGMVQTPAGESWLGGPSGILRIRSADLDHAFANPGRPLAIQIFGAADGLKSPPHSHSRQSIVEGGDGRLWIATQTGTLWLDPSDIRRGRIPPGVSIGSLSADQLYNDPRQVTLPAGTTKFNIDFEVFNFSNPRAAQVRYRLEGRDTEWTEAWQQRQAFYRDLGPGTYRFRVIAANQDGLWNNDGATLEIVIPPTFLQSWLFLVLCAALAVFLLWLAYRMRLAQVAARIRRGFEERTSERERIARELHDTLLQSVQGLVLRIQSVANKMPADGALRTHLESALKRADEVIAEGRSRVQDLRLAHASEDLPELLRSRAVETGFDPAIPIRIVVEGKPRPVHPLVSAEIVRVADEALFNVARHAKATSVQITIRFANRRLAVEIRDDGVGIGREVLEKGQKPGHFGLVGMRERIERIGGNLAVDSQPGMGCAVTMTIPERSAFADQVTRTRLPRMSFKTGKEPSRA
jgi:signal transduction histidine kinase/ligand-binding sensor domain-containing protein